LRIRNFSLSMLQRNITDAGGSGSALGRKAMSRFEGAANLLIGLAAQALAIGVVFAL